MKKIRKYKFDYFTLYYKKPKIKMEKLDFIEDDVYDEYVVNYNVKLIMPKKLDMQNIDDFFRILLIEYGDECDYDFKLNKKNEYVIKFTSKLQVDILVYFIIKYFIFEEISITDDWEVLYQ